LNNSSSQRARWKLSLLVRQDPDGVMRRYAHLGTGNYNTSTARIYADVSLLTADPEITGAVHDVFSFLTAYAEHPNYGPLMVAPLNLAEHCLALSAREAEHARHGRPAHIIAKMNALQDKNIIMALYGASQAGVKIDLIVRGICALRPGVRGVSDHISVRSIVGRFLEHSRIYFFANGGQEEAYLGSADWMPRNLYERVEVIFPVKDELLRERVRQEILESYLADHVKSRFLQKDGVYVRAWRAQGKRRPPTGSAAFSAQDFLISLAEGKQALEGIPAAPGPRRSRTAIGKER
jgi:polyphosphate kinase